MRFLQFCFLFIIGTMFFTGCHSPERQDAENNPIGEIDNFIGEAEFVPNPQDVPEQDVKRLPIGAPAPDFHLPGVDGEFYSLEDFKDAKVLVIIFTCNHCPTAQAYEDRIIRLVDDYKNQGVEIVAISPNSIKAILPEELGYTDLSDSYEEMKIRASTKGFNFKYLYDGDTQEASLKYGPTSTPHAYVFDSERKLRYNGRLDESEKPGTANAEDLRSAIDAALLNVEILEPVLKTFGCSIKWAWKQEYVKEVNHRWELKPVPLLDIDATAARSLIRNYSKKLRLINFWATWCGPCIVEYPDLVTLQRMYGARNFEFVSVSLDIMDQRSKVARFLVQNHSAVKNFIYSGTDVYRLIDIVGNDWEGNLPFTILIEPGGKIVYKKDGIVDLLELKRAIVDHPLMGRYY